MPLAPDTCRLVQFDSFGGPEVMGIMTAPLRPPGPKDVVVEARSIGVGMPDVLLRRGEYPHPPPLPAVPGSELAGVVVAAGDRVSRLSVGARVLVSARDLPQRGGCYADHVTVGEDVPYPLPSQIGFDDAVALPNYQVATLMLDQAVPSNRPRTILVMGATGGVGSALVQLAAHAGDRVVGMVGGDDRVDVARQLGCAAIIDRLGPVSPAVAVSDATEGRGVDVVFDPVAGADTWSRLELLAPLGTLVLYGFLGGVVPAGMKDAMTQRSALSPAVRMFTMHSFDNDPVSRREAMATVLKRVGNDGLKPLIGRRFLLCDAAAAHAMLEEGKVIGKVILTP